MINKIHTPIIYVLNRAKMIWGMQKLGERHSEWMRAPWMRMLGLFKRKIIEITFWFIIR